MGPPPHVGLTASMERPVIVSFPDSAPLCSGHRIFRRGTLVPSWACPPTPPGTQPLVGHDHQGSQYSDTSDPQPGHGPDNGGVEDEIHGGHVGEDDLSECLDCDAADDP